MADVTKPTPITDITEVCVAGDDYTITVTLSRDGDTSTTLDGTITCSVVSSRDPGTELLSDIALSITAASSRQAQLALTDVQTALLDTVSDYTKSVYHLADIKNVESDGDIVHYGPFRFPVRRAIT